VIVSDSVETTDRLCSTISTVRFAATRLISDVMRPTSSCAMPAVGSSSSIISGSSASVVAISSARLRPVGQLDRRRRLEAAQADRVDQLGGAGVERAQRRLAAPEVVRVAALALQRDAHVLEHRQVPEHGRDLEAPHQAPCARSPPGASR
jgi:hypothetical protein